MFSCPCLPLSQFCCSTPLRLSVATPTVELSHPFCCLLATKHALLAAICPVLPKYFRRMALCSASRHISVLRQCFTPMKISGVLAKIMTQCAALQALWMQGAALSSPHALSLWYYLLLFIAHLLHPPARQDLQLRLCLTTPHRHGWTNYSHPFRPHVLSLSLVVANVAYSFFLLHQLHIFQALASVLQHLPTPPLLSPISLLLHLPSAWPKFAQLALDLLHTTGWLSDAKPPVSLIIQTP